MKKNRTVPFTMVLFLLIFHSMSFAQSEKKYPPYPDVWINEIIIPDRSVTDAHINIIKMQDGDFMVIYTTKVKKIGNNFKFSYGGYLFFSGRRIDFGEDVKEVQRIEDEARKENRWHRFIIIDEPKIVFRDGSSIELKNFRMVGRCDPPLSPSRHYLVRDSHGNVKEKIFLYLLIKPKKEEINPYCERNWDYKEKYYYRRVNMVGGYRVPLEDDTFLMISSYIDDNRMRIRMLRLNKDLTTKVDLMKYNLFLLDRSEYIDVINKSKWDDNSANEVVADYLLKLKKGGKRDGDSK